MPVPSHIARRLREVLGPEAGGDLVSWMDETSSVRADISEMRHEMVRMEARISALIEHTKSEFSTQVERTKGELSAQIERSKADLMKWSFVFWCGAVAAIAALAGVLRA